MTRVLISWTSFWLMGFISCFGSCHFLHFIKFFWIHVGLNKIWKKSCLSRPFTIPLFLVWIKIVAKNKLDPGIQEYCQKSRSAFVYSCTKIFYLPTVRKGRGGLNDHSITGFSWSATFKNVSKYKQCSILRTGNPADGAGYLFNQKFQAKIF